MLVYPIESNRRFLITRCVCWEVWTYKFLFFYELKWFQFSIYLSYWLHCISLLELLIFTSLEGLPSEISFIPTFHEPYVLVTWLIRFANTFHLSHAVKCVIKKHLFVCLSKFKYLKLYWNCLIYFYLCREGGERTVDLFFFFLNHESSVAKLLRDEECSSLSSTGCLFVSFKYHLVVIWLSFSHLNNNCKHKLGWYLGWTLALSTLQ